MLGHHPDPGHEAVGHAGAHAVPLQGATDLGRRIGRRFIEWQAREGGEEFADVFQLKRRLRPREQLGARDQRGPELSAVAFQSDPIRRRCSAL